MTEPTPIPVPDGLRGLPAEAIDALRELRLQLEGLGPLGERETELTRIGALVALGAPAESIGAHVTRALATGLSAEEVWGCLLAVAPLVGVPRLIGAVPAVRAALDV
jgi:alkylhydroperoxidase/carboxymuconolactone decarboxylase family protein YurZ